MSRSIPARFLPALIALALACLLAFPAVAQTARPSFPAFLQSLWPDASAAGVSRQTFDTAMAGLTLDPSLGGAGPKQSEFLRPMKGYVAEAASPGRVARGRAMAQRWGDALAQEEARTGVPGSVVLAIWGMETDFGAAAGKRDVLRSLASLAYYRAPERTFREEVVAALVMLERGMVSRAKLLGSWAGAMGHPQFMPSSYLKYALSLDGGPADIWNSVPDSLASIGRFLQQSGWRAGQGWGGQVSVPAGFDHAAIRQPVRSFQRAGIAPLTGSPLPSGDAMLFYPAGAGGPAFLLGENFFVLKAYNFSDSYAMAVAVLADRIAGREPLRGTWPDDAAPLDTAERSRLQTLLSEAGLYKSEVDGRFGPVTRDAVHAWQRRAGVAPADGHPSRAVLERLQASR